MVKTSRFQGVKVWSLVRELRSYTLNLAKGGKNAILKNKTKRGGLWASQGWNWDPAELTSCFFFPFSYQVKYKNKYLFCFMLSIFFLKFRNPHFPGFDLAKDFKKLSVHSVQLNTSNKNF